MNKKKNVFVRKRNKSKMFPSPESVATHQQNVTVPGQWLLTCWAIRCWRTCIVFSAQQLNFANFMSKLLSIHYESFTDYRQNIVNIVITDSPAPCCSNRSSSCWRGSVTSTADQFCAFSFHSQWLRRWVSWPYSQTGKGHSDTVHFFGILLRCLDNIAISVCLR